MEAGRDSSISANKKLQYEEDDPHPGVFSFEELGLEGRSSWSKEQSGAGTPWRPKGSSKECVGALLEVYYAVLVLLTNHTCPWAGLLTSSTDACSVALEREQHQPGGLSLPSPHVSLLPCLHPLGLPLLQLIPHGFLIPGQVHSLPHQASACLPPATLSSSSAL